MLKENAYLYSIIFFMAFYCQNFLKFSSLSRKDFYFVGMATAFLGFSYIINQITKSKLTTFLFWFCIGNLINEIFYSNNLNYLEFILGLTGVIINIYLDARTYKRTY